MSVNKVLGTYKGLIRAAHLAFANDAAAFQAAVAQMRKEYREDPAPEGAELRKRLQMAKDVAHILRTNVVQGEHRGKNDADKPVYRLRIHKETELGDNDDRFGSPLPSGSADGCCGGSSKQ